MKLTVRCMAGLKDVTVRRWNVAWKKYGQFYDRPVKVPPVLIQKGVEIVDMKEYMQPKFTKWSPPVPDDPRWVEPTPLEDLPDWKEEPAFSFNLDTQIYEGVTQACLIAKAQHIDGAPPCVQRLMGVVDIPNRDILLQRYIMQSQKWHTDRDKLPNPKPHPDKPYWKYGPELGVLPQKASLILLKNMLRLCQTHTTEYPSLINRKHIAEPLLDSHVMYKDKAIVQKDKLALLLTSDTWLTPFADSDLVDASVAHKLPDMWPVYPTVDFTETNNYELNSYPGFTGQHKFWCPHTIIQVPSKLDWSDNQYQGSQILTCLFLTAAVARQRFGNDVIHLPEPISVQHLMVNESKIFLTYFQLNTLDLSSEEGIKNIAWTTPPTVLFEKVPPQQWLKEPTPWELENFEGSAFEPLLAAYLNGLPELSAR